MVKRLVGILLAAGFAVPAPALAVETVCASGCTHTTIQAGVAAASVGETVTVGPGTYTGQVTIGKALVLQGAGAATTVLDGQGTVPGSSADGLLSISLAAPGAVTVTGLTLRDPQADADLVLAQGPSGASFVLDDIRGEGSPVAGGTGSGVKVFGAAALELRNSRISGTGRMAVDLDLHTGSTIVEDNILGPNTQSGFATVHLAVSSLGADVTTPQRIRDNVITSLAHGIMVVGGFGNNPGVAGYTDVVISDNTVSSGPEWSGILLSNQDGQAEDGVISDAVVSGNRLIGTRAGGGFATGVWITGKLVDTAVTGNWISGYDTGVKITQNDQRFPTGTEMHFNRLAGNTAGFLRQTSTNAPVDATHNWWGCNGGPGTTGCSTSTGIAVTTAPWLVLGLAMSRPALQTGGDTAVATATLTTDSAGGTPAGNVLPSDTVTFATPGATMSPASAPFTSHSATSTVTSGETPIATAVSATFDGFTVSAPITITAPPETDSDGDGLSDAVEAAIGTDPARADTDGDGVGDKLDACPTVTGGGADGCPAGGGTTTVPGGTDTSPGGPVTVPGGTATTPGGTTTTPTSPPAKPRLSSLRAGKLKAKKGGRFTFELGGGAAGDVRFTLSRKTRGRKAGKRCLAPPRRGAYKRCVRVVTLPGSVTARAVPGRNTFTWKGRLAGRVVKRGTYTLRAVAVTTGGRSAAVSVTVRVA